MTGSAYPITLGLTVVLSLGGHVALFRGLTDASREAPKRQRRVEVAMLERKPQPPPEAKRTPRPRREPPKPKTVEAPPSTPPAPNRDAQEPHAKKAPPVFGVTLSSVVGPGSGSGFRVRVGNTLMKDPEAEVTPPEEVKPLKPVPVHRLTRLPKVRGQCLADYPPEAKSLGIEGRLPLEVEVRADGSVGRVRPLGELGHGLEAAAVLALKRCHFEPAMVQGEAVATRIQYTYVFVIEG